ncbi:MAG: VWA domain-containing protein [Clostridia bacterium]|nr:VWA domain-containing protein [Clostridia bacterium]
MNGYSFLIQPLGLLGLLGIPIIILIYLLKSKYVSKPVSSTFIWKRSLKYVKRKLPLSFIFSLLLILQLLTVILASFAISRPQIPPIAAKDTIIILDSSASMMNKNQDGKTRYELAIEQIEKEAGSAGDINKITVISAGSEVKYEVMRSTDRMQILGAMSEASCQLGSIDLDSALEFANNVQNINPNAKIYLYTDKPYLEADGVEIKDFSGENDVNVAITNLTDSYMGGRYSFNATISVFAPEPEDPNEVLSYDVYLKLTIDGQLVSTAPVTLNAGKNIVTLTHKETLVANNGVFYQMSPLSEYTSAKVEIEKVTVAGEKESIIVDGLAEDNSRNIFSTTTERVKILVVSKNVKMTKDENGNEEADPAQTTFLVALLRNIGYTLSNKTDIKNEISKVNDGGAIEGYDLYIFDGLMPETLPTDGAVWFINPPDNPVGTAIQLDMNKKESVTGSPLNMIPAVDTGSDAYKILTKSIGTRNIAIKEFHPLSVDPTMLTSSSSYEEVFTCDNSSIILAGREANVRIVCWGFAISDSNIAMLIDFPLLINNMLTYSLPSSVADRSFEVGQTVKFNAPVGATEIKLQFHHDDGTVNDLDVMEAMDTEFVLERLGNYGVLITYENGHEQTIMMPTSIPAEESDITTVGDTVVAMDVTTIIEVIEEPMEIWPYIVMALLAVLIIEWGVYYRDEF